MSINKYYKIKSKESKSNFVQQRPNQLTIKEQELLIKTSLKNNLSHLSIKQLQLYAFRQNIIHCHYDRWRKYIHLYNPCRIPKKKKRFKSSPKKLKVSRPNKGWHIDVTYFRGVYGNPIYLQVIIDSYTRAVISWVVSNKRNNGMTIRNLKIATKKIKPTFLYCDGGGENINYNVNSFLKNKKYYKNNINRKNKTIKCKDRSIFQYNQK